MSLMPAASLDKMITSGQLQVGRFVLGAYRVAKAHLHIARLVANLSV